MNIPDRSNPRVVIVGGGFGGLQLAKRLRKKRLQVVLLDKQNYHAFQPLLYQVATAGIEPGSIAYPFRKIIHFFEDYFFRLCEVREIVTGENKIITDIGELNYDYLVLATGATSNFFGMANVEKHAMPMKSVSEALDIRSLMLQNFEKALLVSDLKERESMMSIIIVGGGPTGVELAGAIAELRKDILPHDYPDLDIRAMDIHLVEANDRLLKEMSQESSERAYEVLKKMDVEIWLSAKVSDYDGTVMTTSDGKKMKASMLIWAAGVKAVIPAGIPKESINAGRVVVDRFNRVKGLSNVFAIGDVAKMSTEKYPNGHPMVAQPAIQQGKLLAKNISLLCK
ncbi:MAG: FAD-dependent oxidoreductase, partial [Crocinitomicaceae bacterium]|nr:FAD-dependent oxidoreductase [Crocinitomicaceae bacterium]